jgi:hypothetical protein
VVERPSSYIIPNQSQGPKTVMLSTLDKWLTR